ncbi:hypothetical protein H0X32_03670 [Patescibacteria group bacterium]|nr:hypothetical protein [Patescibacteria group bacterium]
MSLEGSHIESGEDLVRKMKRESLPPLPLNDPRVQVMLARQAFPNEADPMDKWLEGEEVRDSLSRRFRAFKIDPALAPADQSIDIRDEAALQKLLDKVRVHEPERTIH